MYIFWNNILIKDHPGEASSEAENIIDIKQLTFKRMRLFVITLSLIRWIRQNAWIKIH